VLFYRVLITRYTQHAAHSTKKRDRGGERDEQVREVRSERERVFKPGITISIPGQLKRDAWSLPASL
jgi:hypothetical protein